MRSSTPSVRKGRRASPSAVRLTGGGASTMLRGDASPPRWIYADRLHLVRDFRARRQRRRDAGRQPCFDDGGSRVGDRQRRELDLVQSRWPRAGSEPVDSLTFSTVFAFRYAFSKGDFGRPVGDADAITPVAGPFQEARGTLRIHELSFYVGSGLHF